MAGKTIVITGASDGIGREAARVLHAQGHTVIPVGRNPERTAQVAREVGSRVHLADFADLASVRELADDLLAQYGRIDVLANNAGGIFGKVRESTIDGHEMTFQVNYLAPFLLTQLLMERLIASAATIINTSSVGARLFGQLDIDDLDNERSFSATRAYGTAKLAQILHVKELDRRYRSQGIGAVAFHPGNIATSFSNAPSSPMRLIYQTPLKKLFLTSIPKGADTLVYLAEGEPGRDYAPGEYYVKRKPARTHAQADDAALARELFERSERMLGL